MRRWGLIFALLVSAGLNAGILTTLWVTRAQEAQPRPPAPRPTAVAQREGQPPVAADLPDRPPPPEPSQGPPPRGPEREGPREGHPAPQGPPGPPPEEVPFGGDRDLGPPGTAPTIPPPRLRELAARLGLSGEVRERFFTLQLQMITAMRDGRWRIQRLRREVRVEMQSGRPDRDKIEARLAEIQSAQLALERQTVRTILDTREILDGEAERQYLEFITRLRLGAGEGKPNGTRPRGDGRMLGRPGLPGGPGFDPRREPPGNEPQNPPSPDSRLNRPGGPQGGGFGGRPGGFGRPRPFPRGQRMLTPEERLERRRRFEEWQTRQGAGQPAAPPPQRSEPEGETPPPA